MDYTDTDLDDSVEAEDMADGAPAAEDPEPSPEPFYGSPVRAGKYRFFSVLLFVLTAGGLFLGLIGNAAAWLKPSYYFGDSGLNNSLLGFFFTRMKELFTSASVIFSGTGAEVFRHVIALLAAVAVVAAVILSLISTIVSFVSPERAKTMTAVGGTVSLLTYALLFVWAYCVNSLAMETFGGAAIDVPVALIALALFAVMTVYTVMENGLKGLCGAGVCLFAAATAFAFFFPASFTETGLTLLPAFKEHPVYNFLSVLTVCILLALIVVSAVALPRKKGRGIFRTLLSGAGFVSAVALAIAGCGLGGTWGLKFFQNGSFLPSLLLLFASLGSLLLSLLVIVLDRKRRKALYDGYYDYDDGTETAEPEEELTDAESVGDEVSEESEDLDAEADDGEMDEFEEKMFSYIRKAKEPERTEEEKAPPLPYMSPAAPPQQPSVRPVTLYTDPSTLYTYDPFIDELTPEEKNEFGDLFIACKSGKYGDLPVYRIGGDNTEFFDKVWIRYGMYDMSQPLRDKLFNYLRKYRSK